MILNQICRNKGCCPLKRERGIRLVGRAAASAEDAEREKGERNPSMRGGPDIRVPRIARCFGGKGEDRASFLLLSSKFLDAFC